MEEKQSALEGKLSALEKSPEPAAAAPAEEALAAPEASADITEKEKEAGFQTALQHSVNRRNVFRVGTGSGELNKLLGGGLESMTITEVGTAWVA